jgi:general stress protein YciG
MEMDRPKARRGFAAMSPERQREIASKGGRMAHEKGAAHKWTVDEAREAGRKGGCTRHGGKAASLSSELEPPPRLDKIGPPVPWLGGPGRQ